MRLVVACVSFGVLTLGACTTPNPNLTEETDEASSGAETTMSGSGVVATSETTGVATSTSLPTSGPTTGPTTTPTTIGDSTTDQPTATDTADTDRPASCGAGSVCVADAPAGWLGPVAWSDTNLADAEPACPDGYPEQSVTAFDDLVAPAAACECSCGTASGAACDTVTLEYHGADSNCITADASFDMTSTCSGQPAGSDERYWQVPQPGVTGGSCSPTASEDVEPFSWSARSTVCGGASGSGEGCNAGESCLDTPTGPFAGRVCVWQPGDLECPAGAFADRFIRHSAVDDSRGCADCTCAAPTGTCSGSVFLWTDNTCNANPDDSVTLGGSCSLVSNGAPSSGRHGATTLANVECEPSVGTAVGEAEPSDPITLCCQDV